MTETKLFPEFSSRKTAEKELSPAEVIGQVNSLEAEISILGDEALKQKTVEFRKRLATEVLAASSDQFQETQERVLNQILPEVFAVVRETSRRVLGMRQYDVQLLVGLALHQGNVAEMRTGEGKTLAATLAVYLNALTLNPEWINQAQQTWGDNLEQWEFRSLDGIPVGNGAHVVTVNDYLARRDARLMAHIYDFLGLNSGVLQNSTHTSQESMEPAFLVDLDERSSQENQDQLATVSRREAYQADITYGTNSEFGFDYLRDHMRSRLEDQVQRGHHFAVVDEVDEVLIDEAITPLIISGPSEREVALYQEVSVAVKQLQPDDYEIDEANRKVILTPAGERHLSKILGRPLGSGYLKEYVSPQEMNLLGHVNQALLAEYVFQKDKDYLVLPDQESGLPRVFIVDAFTGHLMAGRTWSDGLHQAIEAKEGLEISGENMTYASITIQNYFRMYQKLAGMTGTALEAEDEFSVVYQMETEVIPTNLAYQASRPDSMLVRGEREAETGLTEVFYAHRDQPDIPLFWERTDHPDLVFPTEEAQLTAVIAELTNYHQRGQPVLVGTTSVRQSEDLSQLLQAAKIEHQVLNARKHGEEGQIIARAGAFGAVTIATNIAGRGVDIKLGGELSEEVVMVVNQVLRESGIENFQDLTLSEQQRLLEELDITTFAFASQEIAAFRVHLQDEEKVRELGGVHVIGTQPHRSRRIDQQLRGRASRQGDPGSSRFILTMQSDLMIANQETSSELREFMDQDFEEEFSPEEMMQALRLIDKAQTRALTEDSMVRQHLLEYDDVQAAYRERIYGQLQRVLVKEDLTPDLEEMVEKEVAKQLDVLRNFSGEMSIFLRWVEKVQPILETKDDTFPSLGMELISQEISSTTVGKQQFLERALAIKESFIQEKQAGVLRGLESILELIEAEIIVAAEDITDLIEAIAGDVPGGLKLSTTELAQLNKQQLAAELSAAIKQAFDDQINDELGSGDSRAERVAELLAGEGEVSPDGTTEFSTTEKSELIREIFFEDQLALDADHARAVARFIDNLVEVPSYLSVIATFSSRIAHHYRLKTARSLAVEHLSQAQEFIQQQFVDQAVNYASQQRLFLTSSITLAWMNYLTQMEKLRVGVGLEAYAQRDPLAVYKQQASDLFAKMLEKIQVEVVGQMFTVTPAVSSLST